MQEPAARFTGCPPSRAPVPHALLWPVPLRGGVNFFARCRLKAVGAPFAHCNPSEQLQSAKSNLGEEPGAWRPDTQLACTRACRRPAITAQGTRGSKGALLPTKGGGGELRTTNCLADISPPAAGQPAPVTIAVGERTAQATSAGNQATRQPAHLCPVPLHRCRQPPPWRAAVVVCARPGAEHASRWEHDTRGRRGSSCGAPAQHSLCVCARRVQRMYGAAHIYEMRPCAHTMCTNPFPPSAVRTCCCPRRRRQPVDCTV